MQTAIQSVGIDISKAKFDVAFLGRNQSGKLATFDNDPKGIKQFLRCLTEQGTDASVPCVLESTGMYHLPVALMVANAGFKVNCINPLITKRFQRSSVRNSKTDSIDAMRLAKIGVQEPNLSVFKADKRAIESRKIVSYIAKLETLRSQIKASKKAMEDMKEITGLAIDLSKTDEAVRSITKQIEILLKEVENRSSETALFLADRTDGLSRERAAIIFAFLQDKEFKTRDELVAFVGLDIMQRESGNWKGKSRLSKRGNPYARKILFQIAWGLKSHNQIYKERYDELRKDGKDYRTALIILARKFLRYLFAYHWKGKVFPSAV